MPKVYSAVKAIIQNKNKFLIIKEIINNRTIWDLPGGKIKYGESPYDALHREVKEEVGLDIKIIKSIGLYWFFKIADQKQIVCATFLCQPKNNKINLSSNPAKDENILEFKWITKKEFLSDNYPTGHESIKKLIANL